MSQETPEGPAFVDAYHRVGSPRIKVFVNRSLDGSFDRGDGNTMDYQAIETIMTDWLSCNGNVMIISPKAARQRLNDQQVRDLQDNQPAAVGAVGQQVGAEILVHVQAHPTRQVEGGRKCGSSPKPSTRAAASRSVERWWMFRRHWISRRSTATRDSWRAS
jgi:hypothetical protein